MGVSFSEQPIIWPACFHPEVANAPLVMLEAMFYFFVSRLVQALLGVLFVQRNTFVQKGCLSQKRLRWRGNSKLERLDWVTREELTCAGRSNEGI
jgi:hypothetical protein